MRVAETPAADQLRACGKDGGYHTTQEPRRSGNSAVGGSDFGAVFYDSPGLSVS